MTLLVSPTTRFHRVLDRMGRGSCNENNRNYDNQRLSPSKPTRNSVSKCQKVLIATSGKNGLVENKTVCTTKINSRNSSSSLTVSNGTTEEDVSPKRVLLRN